MLHELLLALAGHPGDIFVPYPEDAPTRYAIPTDFPFLHSAERTALERLAVLGLLYTRFTNFIERYSKPPNATLGNSNTSPTKKSKPKGSYLCSFCSGLDRELEGYRTLIVECERKILNKLDMDTDGGRTPVSYLEHVFTNVHLLKSH